MLSKRKILTLRDLLDEGREFVNAQEAQQFVEFIDHIVNDEIPRQAEWIQGRVDFRVRVLLNGQRVTPFKSLKWADEFAANLQAAVECVGERNLIGARNMLNLLVGDLVVLECCRRISRFGFDDFAHIFERRRWLSAAGYSTGFEQPFYGSPNRIGTSDIEGVVNGYWVHLEVKHITADDDGTYLTREQSYGEMKRRAKFKPYIPQILVIHDYGDRGKWAFPYHENEWLAADFRDLKEAKPKKTMISGAKTSFAGGQDPHLLLPKSCFVPLKQKLEGLQDAKKSTS